MPKEKVHIEEEATGTGSAPFTSVELTMAKVSSLHIYAQQVVELYQSRSHSDNGGCVLVKASPCV